MGRPAATFLAAVALLSGCLAPRPTAPSAPPAVVSASTAPTPLRSSLPPVANTTPSPTATPAPVDDRCPPFTFDQTAILGQEFHREFFERDESTAIANRFVQGLKALDAGGSNVDRCDLFTDRGLATAAPRRPVSRAADRRERLIDGDLLVLRVASEDTTTSAIKPPRVPLDVDLRSPPTGARITDPRTTIVRHDARDPSASGSASLRLRWPPVAGRRSAADLDRRTWSGARLQRPCHPGRRAPASVRMRPGARTTTARAGSGATQRERPRTSASTEELRVDHPLPVQRARDDPDDRPALGSADRPASIRWEYVRDPTASSGPTNGWLAAATTGHTASEGR